MKKILTVIGNRPQFVKHFLVSAELRKSFNEFILHTGQHYDYELSRIFFEKLAIPEPDANLGVGSGSHAQQTAKALTGAEKIVAAERPDLVLVYGDTNSTLAGALAAAKLCVPVAHVEAGPRIGNLSEPEEVNRILTDHAASLLFAPTPAAAANLEREGLGAKTIVAGDVMLDAFRSASRRTGGRIVSRLGLDANPYIAVTVHRPHNTDSRGALEEIAAALLNCGARVVFPVHPRTREALEREGLLGALYQADNITLDEPVGYVDMLTILARSVAVLTDSGGLQKEAFFAGKPCVSLSVPSPWPETVEAGFNRPVESKAAAILSALKESPPGEPDTTPFGDGKAHVRIVGEIARFLG